MQFKSKILIFVAFIFLTSCGNSENGLIEKCFGSYKNAILNDKGSEAAKVVTKATLERYGKFIDWCKTYKKEDIEKLPFMDRFLLILIKHRAPKEKILSSDGKDLFIYAVNQGWVGKDSVLKAEIGDVKVSGNNATASLVLNGVKAPFKYHFVKEGNEWKFDLLKVLETTNTMIVKMIQQQGMKENEFIFKSAEAVSGKKIDDSIWEPITK